jgi:signal transduction histidine kinase
VDLSGLLESCDELSGAAPESFERLASVMVHMAFSGGSHIFSEDDSSDAAFLIETGRVRLIASRGAPRAAVVAELGPSELLGEMTALTGHARTTTALAVTDTALWRIDVEDLRAVLTADAGLALRFMESAMDLVLRKDLAVVLGNQRMSELDWVLGVERERARRLQQREARKSERVAMVAHDIRSPVSVMVASAELLRNRLEEVPPESVRRLLDGVVNQGRRLLSLVDRTLDVASIEAGEISYELAPFDLSALARRVATDFTRGDDHIRIDMASPPDLPLAIGDEARCWQVLFNLVGNALKFSRAGSLVRLEFAQRDHFVEVAVRDQGVGIEPDELDNVFDKFARAPSSAHMADGTGLGLYICKRLVEAQGGSIWAESEPGRGSAFFFKLPSSR